MTVMGTSYICVIYIYSLYMVVAGGLGVMWSPGIRYSSIESVGGHVPTYAVVLHNIILLHMISTQEVYYSVILLQYVDIRDR